MSIRSLLAAALDAELRTRGIVYAASPAFPVNRDDCAEIMAAVLDRTVAAGSTLTKQAEQEIHR